MPERKSPRLRTAREVPPPYLLNKFPKSFGIKLGKEIIYLLATKSHATIEGEEWEQVFADCIGATWKKSVVGLDDVTLGNCAWGAKTIIASPRRAKRIRLISGRNSTGYSFDDIELKGEPNAKGEKVLQIWNKRITYVRSMYEHSRTVVLLEVGVFEIKMVRYEPELFIWKWNKNGNLEGFDKETNEHCFSWQHHGAQFTIKENVPDNCLIISVKPPPKIPRDHVFESIVYEDNWITVTERNVR